jgi:hypothetical protein
MRKAEDIMRDGYATRFSSTHQPNKRRGKGFKKSLQSVMSEEGFIVIKGGDYEIQADGSLHLFVPDERAIALVLVKLAKEGNLKAIEMIADRLDGRPAQSVQVIEPAISPNFFAEMEVEGDEE